MLEEIWDSITDGFDYFIHFEWLSDFKDTTIEVFSNLGELSVYGLVFGVCFCLFILFTKQWILDSFTQYMKPSKGLLITIITFIAGFILGYFIGKGYEDTA